MVFVIINKKFWAKNYFGYLCIVELFAEIAVGINYAMNFMKTKIENIFRISMAEDRAVYHQKKKLKTFSYTYNTYMSSLNTNNLVLFAFKCNKTTKQI